MLRKPRSNKATKGKVDRPLLSGVPFTFSRRETVLPAPADLDYGILERLVSSPSTNDLRSTLTLDDRQNISAAVSIDGFVILFLLEQQVLISR